MVIVSSGLSVANSITTQQSTVTTTELCHKPTLDLRSPRLVGVPGAVGLELFVQV